MNTPSSFFESPIGQFVASLLFWLVIAGIAYIVLTYGVRALTRRLPGEMDDRLLGIARKPILVLCVLFGISRSVSVLPLPFEAGWLVGRVVFTLLVIIAARLVYRLVADVAIQRAQTHAAQTETRLDDVLVAIARLLTPVVIFFVAALVVLAHWGVDVAAALAGAGIVGLVVGLALQETFNNIFAGITILADEPFTPGELIMLPDGGSGKVCRVEHIGLRTTKLYHVNDHSMIYVPNRDLANAAITNIFKPSFDMRTMLEVGVAYAANLPQVMALLQEVLREHPNVLVSDLAQHIEGIERAIARQRAALQQPDISDAMRRTMEARLTRWEAAVPKLRAEHALHTQLRLLDAQLDQLAQALAQAEHGGFQSREIQQLRETHMTALQSTVSATTSAMDIWTTIDDPWALPDERASERARWGKANGRLTERWDALARAIQKPSVENESHQDTAATTLRQWITSNYKSHFESWKDPHVAVKGFGASSVDLRVEYFLDDVRLEHFERQRRVNAELMVEVHERFKANNVEIPFPQMDVWMRSAQA